MFDRRRAAELPGGRADALVRRQFAGQPDFVWAVTSEYCGEGLLVQGRASGAALALYYDLIPSERYLIMHLSEVSAPERESGSSDP